MLVPEQIWHALEQGKYLAAARLYLIAEYLYSELKSTKGIAGKIINERFPVYKRQWDTIRPMKGQIMDYIVKELQISILDENVS